MRRMKSIEMQDQIWFPRFVRAPLPGTMGAILRTDSYHKRVFSGHWKPRRDNVCAGILMASR
jgi:hypothetical protein